MGVEGYDVVSIDEALDLANSEELDLVQMNDSEVPVCKLMDYSKYLYEQKKRAKQNSKQSSHSELKEIKFNPNIADYDLAIKAKAADRIMSEGDKIKVTITYKGRMMQMIAAGKGKMDKFESLVTFKHTVDKAPTVEGNRVYMIISPSK